MDAGIIQSAKAMYRKRQMAWILERLDEAAAASSTPDARCGIRQAMQWFMAGLKGVPTTTVKNCWVATKISTPTQMEDLATGERHNQRDASTREQALAGVSAVDMDELTSMLANFGTKPSATASPVPMCDALELVDTVCER